MVISNFRAQEKEAMQLQGKENKDKMAALDKEVKAYQQKISLKIPIY